jgi:hypothetical protein
VRLCERVDAHVRFRRSAEARDPSDGFPLSARERSFALRTLTARFAPQQPMPEQNLNGSDAGCILNFSEEQAAHTGILHYVARTNERHGRLAYRCGGRRRRDLRPRECPDYPKNESFNFLNLNLFSRRAALNTVLRRCSAVRHIPKAARATARYFRTAST